MNTLSNNYYNQNVKIDEGINVNADLEFGSGSFGTYTIPTKDNKILIGYSKGEGLNYSALKTGGKLKASRTLEFFKIKNVNNLLAILPCHQDSICVDKENENTDAIISTYEAPIILAPADCIGLCAVETNSNIIGLCHAGRKGVGLNIVQSFLEEIIDLSINKTGLKKESLNFELIIPPHIFAHEYPHQNKDFMFDDSDMPNWWFKNQEYAKEVDGIYYPNIGGAVSKQIEECFNKNNIKNYSLLASGLSTFSGNGGNSYSKNKDDETKKYYKNLVFIGFLN